MRTYAHGLLAVAVLILAGCAHATPVTVAPIGADDAPKLQRALIGTCLVTSTQDEGSDKKSDASGLSFTFGEGGQASYNAKAFGANVTVKYMYRLEGRNVLMDGPYKAIRVDDFSGQELKFFLYDLTKTYYCTKQ